MLTEECIARYSFTYRINMTEDNVNITTLVRGEINSIGMPKLGDLVKGTVIENTPRELTVDLSPFGVGIVYRGELQNAREVVKNLKQGDAISGKVTDLDNKDGCIELSIAEADRQKAWEAVQELKEQEEIIKIKISGFNRGGLMANLKGLPAFLPASQLVTKEGETLEKSELEKMLEEYIEKEIEVRIIDVNPKQRKLIVSEKAATEMSSKELAKNYEVGQIIEGVVSGVADFGVFVRFTDNPSVEGLVHISEIGYAIVDNPKEVVKIDDPVRVKITDIKDGKISLSLKALKEDPWVHAGEKFKKEQEISGKVYTFHPFGAIVNISGSELQGQVHVADFGSIEEMKSKLVVGEMYDFTIEDVNSGERRILMKLKV